MGGMIAHAELLLDQGGDAAGGPERAFPTEGCGSLGQQARQLGTLGGGEARLATRGRLVAQGEGASGAGAGEPLADRPLRDAQGGGDVALLPALLVQFPGAEAPPFAPILGRRQGRCGSHATH